MRKRMMTAGTAVLILGLVAMTGCSSKQQPSTGDAPATGTQPQGQGQGRRGGNGFGFNELGPALQLLGINRQALPQLAQGGKTLAQLATDKSISRDQLIKAMKDGISQSFDNQVKNGRLTQDQANQQIADAQAKVETEIDQPLSQLIPQGGGNPSQNGRGPAINMQALLDKLGLDRNAYNDAIKSGKTILDLASAKGMTREQLIDALKADFDQQVAKQVQDGTLKAADVDQVKQNGYQRIADLVDGKINFNRPQGNGQQGGGGQ